MPIDEADRISPDAASDSRRRSRLHRVGAPKAADVVADHLRRQIVRGELKEGDILPPEPRLLQLLGVGRPALREAMRMLESESLIRVRRGAKGGAVVRLPDPNVAARSTGFYLQARGVTFADVYQTRAVLEPAAVFVLADRGTAEAHQQLRQAWEAEADSLGDDHAFAHASARFHHRIVELSGVATLAHLSGLLLDITDRATLSSLRSSATGPELRARHIKRAYGAYGHLVGLVEARKAGEAELFWREHMMFAGTLLLAQGRGESVIDVL
ncbi:MAG: GntR family transcriptional regulator, partial [Ilumatobacteraceae bacterium]